MKKINSIIFATLLILGTLSLASCSNDDDDPIEPLLEHTLIGTWKFESEAFSLKCKPTTLTEVLESVYVKENQKYTIEFEKGNIFTRTEFDPTIGKTVVTKGHYLVKANDKVTLRLYQQAEVGGTITILEYPLTDVKVVDQSLEYKLDMAPEMKALIKLSDFWLAIGVEKPASLTIEQFVRTTKLSAVKVSE